MSRRRPKRRGDEPREPTTPAVHDPKDWNAVFKSMSESDNDDLPDRSLLNNSGSARHDWNAVLRGSTDDSPASAATARPTADAFLPPPAMAEEPAAVVEPPRRPTPVRPAASRPEQPAQRATSDDARLLGERRFAPSAPGSRSTAGRTNPFTSQLDEPAAVDPAAATDTAPATTGPGEPQSRATQPNTPQPSPVQPVAPQPSAAETSTAQPSAAQPSAAATAQAPSAPARSSGAPSPSAFSAAVATPLTDPERTESARSEVAATPAPVPTPPAEPPKASEESQLFPEQRPGPVAEPIVAPDPEPVAEPQTRADSGMDADLLPASALTESADAQPTTIQIDPDLVPGSLFGDGEPDADGSADREPLIEDVDLPAVLDPDHEELDLGQTDTKAPETEAQETESPAAELPETEPAASAPVEATQDETEPVPVVRSRPAAGSAEELRYERLRLRVVTDDVERLLLATELIEVIGMPPVRCEVNLCPPGTQLDNLKVHFNPRRWTPEDADIVWGLVSQWLPRVWATLCNRERAADSVVETWVSYKDPALPGEQHLRIATTLEASMDFSLFGRAHRDGIEERTDGNWFDPVVVPEP